MENTVKFYVLSYRDVRTYLLALLFVLGNLVLPQLFHLVPRGGMIWLPIYFFTLIGAYKYGWKVGLLTAIASPLLNSILFGMPSSVVLPSILLKSLLLAVAAGFLSHRYQRVSLLILSGVILFYQCLGTLGEWVINGNLDAALQDIRIGIPGVLLQLFGGYLLIKYVMRK